MTPNNDDALVEAISHAIGSTPIVVANADGNLGAAVVAALVVGGMGRAEAVQVAFRAFDDAARAARAILTAHRNPEEGV